MTQIPRSGTIQLNQQAREWNDDDYLPPRRRPRRKPVNRVLTALIVVLAAAITVVISGTLYVNHMLNQVHHVPDATRAPVQLSNVGGQPPPMRTVPQVTLPHNTPDEIRAVASDFNAVQEEPRISDRDVYNILIVGIDRRPDENESRSDTMIILSLNQRTRKIHLTSLMRAMLVYIPGHDFFLLNSALQFGGIDLLRDTIDLNFRLRIDDYMLIDFSAFTQIIDQVNGIEVELDEAEARYMNADIFLNRNIYTAGLNHLDGKAALTYARCRLVGLDWARTGRQRLVIEKLIEKARLMDLMTLTSLVSKVLPTITTNVDKARLLDLLKVGYNARKYPIEQMMVPAEEDRRQLYIRSGGYSHEVYAVQPQVITARIRDFIEN